MTAALTSTTLVLQATGGLINPLDLETVTSSMNEKQIYSLTDGTGANKASNIFTDERTIAASSSEELDLAGILQNAFGQVISFTKIKAMYFFADQSNTNDILIGGAAANGFATWAGDPTDIVVLKPGGGFAIVAPGATGYAVTAGTGDLLKVENGSGGTSVVYKIILIGESS